ncbi:hypothetical protein M6I34_13855 [Burkholderiaceae bacterium FT117]|uniref:hypothetical protein n=1 Tax=Zeimonas sediminis TaxID=2944268 RepID=UPI002343109C|nr:hypothetical protein [Zeimonas sediminis]MCM5571601.1 hypothetical protein [Zeimonas sediminis]
MRARWLPVAFFSMLVSILAVAADSPFGLSLPPELRTVAGSFAWPGELICRSGLGGAVSGCPSGLAGALVQVLATAAFWSVVLTVVLGLAGRAWRIGR